MKKIPSEKAVKLTESKMKAPRLREQKLGKYHDSKPKKPSLKGYKP